MAIDPATGRKPAGRRTSSLILRCIVATLALIPTIRLTAIIGLYSTPAHDRRIEGFCNLVHTLALLSVSPCRSEYDIVRKLFRVTRR